MSEYASKIQAFLESHPYPADSEGNQKDIEFARAMYELDKKYDQALLDINTWIGNHNSAVRAGVLLQEEIERTKAL